MTTFLDFDIMFSTHSDYFFKQGNNRVFHNYTNILILPMTTNIVRLIEPYAYIGYKNKKRK